MPASIATRVEYINQSDMEKSTPGWDWINNAELLSKAAYGGWDGIDLSLIYGVLSIHPAKDYFNEYRKATEYIIFGLERHEPNSFPSTRSITFLSTGTPYYFTKVKAHMLKSGYAEISFDKDNKALIRMDCGMPHFATYANVKKNDRTVILCLGKTVYVNTGAPYSKDVVVHAYESLRKSFGDAAVDSAIINTSV
jgi:hypothetical protein